MKSVLRSFLFGAVALLAQLTAFGQNGLLSYNGDYRDIEGEQPFTYSYSVAVTGIFIPSLTTPATATLDIISLSRPAGVSEATALSFVSLSQPSVTFTGNGFGQTNTVTIYINVPAGNAIGDYAYRIKTKGDWTGGVSVGDNGTLINMKVRDPGAVTPPPVVTITSPADQSTFTYTPAQGPLVVPFTFTAAAQGSSTIVSLDADLNNSLVSVTSAGLTTANATGSGSLTITSGGLYTLRARASNGTDTAEDTIEFTVDVAAPPPTVTPTNPTVSTYTMTLGQTVSIPVGFTANSPYGPIQSVSATLNGTPLTGLTTTGIGTTDTTSTGSVGITTAGNYTLVYTATNAIGSASKTVNFTVNGVTPPPVVTIVTPAVGTVVTRVAGSAPTQVPFEYAASATYGTIQSSSITLNGATNTVSLAGLNTANATGTGNFSVSAAGTYTIVATASNGSAVASATRTFTVVETTPPSSYTLNWLPPISSGVSVLGGSTVPVKFTLTTPSGATVSDQNVIIAIYEVFANGTSSSPTLYPYGTSGPAAPDYAITGGTYQIDYPTANGAHVYKVEVYSASGTGALLLGTNQLTTYAASVSTGCCGEEILVNHMPTINGTVTGSIRVRQAESITLNGGAVVTKNLYVVGTPTVRLNGKPTFGGTLEGSGASAPTSHKITLNGGATLGNLIRRTDALAMPTVPALANPTGTQSVTVNASTTPTINWSTLKNLTLNGNNGFFTVPPGSYGTFISNGINSGLILGVAGATTPSVYEFQSITLNGQTEIKVVGPVILRVKNGFSSNGILGNANNPSWLTLQIYSGGFTINGTSQFYGCVVAPNGRVTVNSNTIFKGGLSSDYLTVNGGANLQVVSP